MNKSKTVRHDHKTGDTNARGEHFKRCWMCGKEDTRYIDETTRECLDCGAQYAIEVRKEPCHEQ